MKQTKVLKITIKGKTKREIEEAWKMIEAISDVEITYLWSSSIGNLEKGVR